MPNKNPSSYKEEYLLLPVIFAVFTVMLGDFMMESKCLHCNTQQMLVTQIFNQ